MSDEKHDDTGDPREEVDEADEATIVVPGVRAGTDEVDDATVVRPLGAGVETDELTVVRPLGEAGEATVVRPAGGARDAEKTPRSAPQKNSVTSAPLAPSPAPPIPEPGYAEHTGGAVPAGDAAVPHFYGARAPLVARKEPSPIGPPPSEGQPSDDVLDPESLAQRPTLPSLVRRARRGSVATLAGFALAIVVSITGLWFIADTVFG